jgi:hypothetical protein
MEVMQSKARDGRFSHGYLHDSIKEFILQAAPTTYLTKNHR